MANPEFSVIFATDVSAALLRRYLQKDGASSISVRRVAGRSPSGFKRYAIKVQCSRDADEVVRAVIEFGRLSHAT